MSGPSLFVPPIYAAARPEEIVAEYPFASLVTSAADGIHVTSAPIFFEDDGACETLVGHMARRNPHAAALEAGQPALAIFWGPHAYVSSRWYVEKPEVPTWNYVQTQVRGRLDPVDDEDGQLAILRRSADILERKGEPPWTVDGARERVAFLLPYIRSFRIHIERIEGVTKLSQTHPPADRTRVHDALLVEGEPGGVEIARWMRMLNLA
ncbi:FMN-binding negative transcriptional regulator [Phenylobacterium sp.]|uniref:FMN-binding negative transcriptional regulator n=1 Tax=Phenylobacterium sp. TaxID=1871053 RepID=UPI00301B9F4F